MTTAPGEADPLLSRRYKAWLLTVLVIVCTFNYADRAILAVLAQPIKQDLKLSDLQLGMLQGLAFAVLYSVLGVPIGRLAERSNRKGIIAVCVALWSVMTMVCGMTANFAQLLLGRIGVGIGEAGFLSPTSSLVSDHYKANQRASALAIIMLGTPLGFMFGALIAGWIAQEWSWRVAFVAFGAPGLIVALLVAFTLREPPRGLADGHIPTTDKPPSLMAVIRLLWSKPAFRHILIGGSAAAFGLNAVGQFVNPFFVRAHHLNFAEAGLVFGLISGFANGAGTLVGGFGVDWLSKRDGRWAAWGPALGIAITAPVYLVGFAIPNLTLSIILVFIGNLTLITFYTPTFAMLQNMVGPRMRASAVALFSLCFSMIGAGFGPTILGLMSDIFARGAFGLGDFAALCPGGIAAPGGDGALDTACRTAAGDGLRYALLVSQVFFIWAAVHYVLAARTLRKDMYVPGS